MKSSLQVIDLSRKETLLKIFELNGEDRGTQLNKYAMIGLIAQDMMN